jgi:hypothetical protein
MMANRNTLHKNKIEAFKEYLDNRGIGYRPGKGTWQELQVLTPEFGWQCIYSRADMPEHFTVQDKLMHIISDFLHRQSN